ncbi:hypothetical protein FKM82_022908 [Ascaphus truei]
MALEEWRHLLEGTTVPVTILTDHKNLEYLEGVRRSNTRKARWALFFTRFNYLISYRPALQKRPEEINRRSADMWSFAVLLWELVTREVPFADLSNMEIGMKVSLEGLRPTIPPGISPHICKLMKICMNEDPAKRPKFDMIAPILEKMQEK